MNSQGLEPACSTAARSRRGLVLRHSKECPFSRASVLRDQAFKLDSRIEGANTNSTSACQAEQRACRKCTMVADVRFEYCCPKFNATNSYRLPCINLLVFDMKSASGNEHQLPRWLVVLSRLAAVAFLIYAAIFLYDDKVAAASVAGVIAAALALYEFVPKATELSVAGVSLKLREQIEEAEQQVKMLRKIVSVLAENMYLEMAWANRWGGPPTDVIDKRIKSLDLLISELEFTEEERREFKEPYVTMFCRDLAGHLDHFVTELVDRQRKLGNDKPIKLNDGDFIRARDTEGIFNICTRAERLITKTKLIGDDARHVREFAKVISQLISACREAAEPVPDATAFMVQYNRTDARLKEVYPENFN